jgi:hypothetical protein
MDDEAVIILLTTLADIPHGREGHPQGVYAMAKEEEGPEN